MKTRKNIITAVLLLIMTFLMSVSSFAAGPGETVTPDSWELSITKFGSLSYSVNLKDADKALEPYRYTIEIYSMRDGVNWRQYGGRKVSVENSFDVNYSFPALYRFRVKVSFVGGKETDWSVYSAPCTVNAEDVSGGGNSGGPGVQKNTQQETGPGAAADQVPYGPGRTGGRTGWYQSDGTWYYAYANGTYAQNNWEYIDGKWYYFNSDGSMKTDWLYLNGCWYYLLPSGQMATGFNNVNEVWYYFNQSGIMLTGYQVIDGYTYYFDVSGAGIRNTYAPDGNYYDSFGRLTAPVRY